MIGHAEYAQKVEESEKYSKEAYVLKKEVARLKELNREMVEAIKLHCDQCKNEQGIADCNVTECIWHKLLAKNEGR